MALSVAQINALYQDVFKRDADQEGLNYWTSQADVQHPDTLYQRLLNTPEGRKRMISDVYRGVLNRDADQAGMEYWLNSGKSRAEIEQGIMSGDEYAPMRQALGINATLYQDPAYAAYARNSAYKAAELENQRLRKTDQLRAEEGIQYGKYDLGQSRALEGIDNNYGGRGMYNSGGRLRDTGRTISDYGMQRNEYALSQANKLSDMQAQNAQDMSDLSRTRDDEEVAARNRLWARDAGVQ